MSESIKAIITVTGRGGYAGAKSVFVTDNELIITSTTGTLGKATGFFLGGLPGVMMASVISSSKVEKELTRSGILSTYKKALILEYSEIDKIAFSKWGAGAVLKITANNKTRSWYLSDIPKNHRTEGQRNSFWKGVGRSAIKNAFFDAVPDTVKKESTFD